MIRILHAADLHLDSPFASMRPDQAAARRQEQRELLFELVRRCNALDCDLLLLAGDLFDSERVFPETLTALRRALSGCRAPVFIAPGNHDPICPGSPYQRQDWPEQVHIFTHQRPESVLLEGVRVWGAAFRESHSGPLLRGFRAAGGPVPEIMVVHGELNGGPSVYNPITEEDVRRSGLDYLALGHIHALQVRKIGDTTVGNPGCPMGRGFDEAGEKGVLYVELDRKVCRAEPISLGARQYRILRVPAGEAPLENVLRALPADSRRDICRIILTGVCADPELPALEAALRDRVYGLELIDRTEPPFELWAGQEADSLRGAFLRRMKQDWDRAPEQEREKIALAVRIGLAVMDGREVPEC